MDIDFHRRSVGLAFAALPLGMVVGCAVPGRNAAGRFVLGVQAAKPQETRAAWQPLVDDLARRFGAPVELVTASQSEIVKAMAAGHVDVAWLSSSTAIDAAADAGARTFALYYNVNGTQGYKAVIVTRSDAGIGSLDEALAPGKYRYAAGARTSTSGYVLPQYFLFSPRRTTAEALFKSVRYAGHFPNLEALWSRQVDVIVNNTTDLAVFQQRTPGAADGLKVLWESPMVPNDVLMVRPGLAAQRQQALATLFLGYGKSPQEKELLRKASGISHFVPSDNTVLAPVSDFKFGMERSQVEQDATLDAPARQRRLKEIDERAERFRRTLTSAFDAGRPRVFAGAA